MTKTILSRRRFLKTAGVLCASLAGAGALGGCAPAAEEAEEAAAEREAAPVAEPEPAPEPAPTPQDPSPAAGNVLVAYFSYPETTAASDPDHLTAEEDNSTVVKDGRILGNNEFVAGIIARETGADVFRILTTRTYPADHAGLIAQAQDEINADDRPALAEPVPDLSAYDAVFIGYPIWWADLPPVVRSFLDQADLAGKRVYLFNTHGGSGSAGTEREIARILADSDVSDDNLVISRTVVADSEPDIVAWVRGLGF